MVAQKDALDVIANNLANVGTNGFKRDCVAVSTFRGILAECQAAEVAVVCPDASQGPLQSTGRPLDLAIEGDGYFCAQTPDGVRYTRNGAFQISQNRDIVTSSGHLVMGRKGAINVGNSAQVEVTSDGRVFKDGAEADQLRVVTLPEDSLVKSGDSLFDSTGAAREGEPQIRSGFLEKSNVSVVSEMIAMISATRHYEACAKALSAQDEMLGQAVNKLAQV